MYKKQEHSGTGDNVTGNKYTKNTYTNLNDLNSLLQSKLSNTNNKKKYNLDDNNMLSALKEIIIELIEEEQNKSHQLVPIGRVRQRFKSLFDDDTFETLIKQMITENSIAIEDTQICFLNKQTKYKLNLK